MMADLRKQRLGKWGERIAADYLAAQGYLVCGHNVRTPHGEIDLVVEKDGVIVFVEVKTRSGTEFGMPEEAVTKTKRDHLLASIAWYWQHSESLEKEWRVDVIAILRSERLIEPEIEHFENAIQ
jgi:putative endonuclease